MLSHTTLHTPDTLVPSDFKTLISSLSPQNQLETSISDISVFKNGDEADAASKWLTGEEKIRLDKFSFQKRRSEWLFGRICAKQAVLNLLTSMNISPPTDARDFAIAASQTGRPFVHFAKPNRIPTNIEISISHSHGKAVGIAGADYCGIDIQLLNNTLFKVRDRFCSDVESAVLNEIPADELVHLGLLWVAKEAIRKCLSGITLAGFQDIRLLHIREQEGFYVLHFLPEIPGIIFHSTDHIQVATHFTESFAIAVCSIGKERLHAGTA